MAAHTGRKELLVTDAGVDLVKATRLVAHMAALALTSSATALKAVHEKHHPVWNFLFAPWRVSGAYGFQHTIHTLRSTRTHYIAHTIPGLYAGRTMTT